MVICYMRAGTLCVITPNLQERVARDTPAVADMTQREYLQWLIAKHVPADATDVQIVRREFVDLKHPQRNAWGKAKLDEFAQKDRERGPNPDLDKKPERR